MLAKFWCPLNKQLSMTRTNVYNVYCTVLYLLFYRYFYIFSLGIVFLLTVTVMGSLRNTHWEFLQPCVESFLMPTCLRRQDSSWQICANWNLYFISVIINLHAHISLYFECNHLLILYIFMLYSFDDCSLGVSSISII